MERVEIELTSRQVEILLVYSHPFDEEEEQLKSFAGKPGNHRLKSDEFYLPRLIGDLVYSAKTIHDETLLEEFDEICTIIESTISQKAGTSTLF